MLRSIIWKIKSLFKPKRTEYGTKITDWRKMADEQMEYFNRTGKIKRNY